MARDGECHHTGLFLRQVWTVAEGSATATDKADERAEEMSKLGGALVLTLATTRTARNEVV